MSTLLNRRNWIKHTTLATGATAFLGRSVFKDLKGSIGSPSPSMNFWEWELAVNKDIPELRARLLANENPYGPSAKAQMVIREAVSIGNRYGHKDAATLIEMLAQKEGVTSDHIMLGPGSSDLLEKVAISRFMTEGNIVSADPAYMSLIKTAKAMQAEWRPIPLMEDYSHDLEAMEAAIDTKTKLVYICNPNNPTGTITSGKKLWDFCNRVSDRVPIFVDEAYLEFMNPTDKMSMIGLVNEGKNIIISRTFSKVHGMAGLRVGYIVAQPPFLEELSAVWRGNMGLNITALKGAIVSLRDEPFLASCVARNTECREYVCSELDKMGFTYMPSQTSFVLFPIEMEGKPFLEEMFGKGIGVRSFYIDGQSYCRVSIGTINEMKDFVGALKEVLV